MAERQDDASGEGSPDEAEAARRERRRARDLRHAHAEGLMLGIRSMLGPGDVAIDCGANIGDVTLPLAATGARVIAFEPDPFAFAKLQGRAGEMPNVTLHQAAVGVTEGTLRLMRAQGFAGNPVGGSVKSTTVPGGRGIAEGEGIAVPCIALPDLLRRLIAEHGRIALLKLDIEGAELDILEAMLAEDLFDGIGLTLAETHERKFRALRPRFRALRAQIAARFPQTRVNLDWV